jgi:hypothetical protein
MPQKRRIAFFVSVVGLAVLAAHVIQGNSAGAASPYKVVPGWGQLASPLKWGEVPNVAIDPKGTVFVFTRSEPPVVELNAAGKVLKTWTDRSRKRPKASRSPKASPWTSRATYTRRKPCPAGSGTSSPVLPCAS